VHAAIEKLFTQALKAMNVWEITIHQRMATEKSAMKITQKELIANKTNVDNMVRTLTEEILKVGGEKTKVEKVIHSGRGNCSNYEGLLYSPFEM
jgi:hypothetical protein